MANKFVTAIFGDYSKKEVKRVKKTADKVLALEDKYAAMSDKELTSQTEILKGRLANGETLDDILPDAFAVCREGAWRVLGMKHFPVQIIGGIVLHQGRIAEMKTGEGKTLVATLPAYLNALTGEGVHIVTVNDYLAKRDSEWMGKLYRFLGLKVGLIIHEKTNEQRQDAYNAVSLTELITRWALTIFVTIWFSIRKKKYSVATFSQLSMRSTQSLLMRLVLLLSSVVRANSQLTFTVRLTLLQRP